MRFARLALFAATTLIVGSCGNSVGASKAGSISGSVIKGPVSGATVVAFAVDDDGRRTDELGRAATDDVGAFNIDVKDHTGAMLLCGSQGLYTEEATGGVVQVGPLELCALVRDFARGDNTTGVLVTPWTTLHAELSSCFSELGREATLEGAANRASLRLNDFLSAGVAGFDLDTTVPTDVTNATGQSLSPEVWSGILLAGLSQSAVATSEANGVAPGVRFTAVSLVDVLRIDLAGGCVFDGVGPGGADIAQGTVSVGADTLRGAPGGLAQSINTFLRGTRNTSGINEASVAEFTRRLSAHQSEIFGGGAVGDLDAPVVVIVEPVAGAVSGSPTIRVTATDASEITTLRFTSPTFLVDTGTLACEPTTSCTLTATLNTSLIEGGAATIGVEAIDVAGNRRSASVAVTVNNSAPTLQIISPADESPARGIVSIVATASDPEGLESFVVDVPGSIIATQCAPPVLTTNCDSDPNPLRIVIEWDTTQANEGPLTISFTATDTARQSAFASVDVTVDNLAAGVFNGRVDLGSPVFGGTVSVFELNADGSRGPLLGTDTDIGNDGAYQVEDATSHTGPLLVVATLGNFVDVASGLGLALSGGQELLAAVEAGSPGGAVVANVNAWTTLAARRALSHPTEAATIGDTIALNRRLFEAFFRRPSPEAPLPILRTVSANLTDDTPDPEASDAALLALTHAGLSRLAADTSLATGGSVGSITLVDVIAALGRDLEDSAGQFNGRGVGDVEIHLDPANTVDVDSLTPRARLAIAIFAFTANSDVGPVVQPRNKSSITAASIAQPNRLLDDVALYDDARLFPVNQPPEPFDRQPPAIDFTFAPPNATAALGDTLSGAVTVFGFANDVSDIVRFEIVAPDTLVGQDLLSTFEDLGVTIGTNEAPNAEDVALTCGLVAGDPPLNFDNMDRQVCLCAEATDVAANTGSAVACFARAGITGVISPASPALLGLALPIFSFDGASGIDLEECVGTVVVDAGGEEEDSVRIPGVVSGLTCTVAMNVGYQEIVPGGAFTLANAAIIQSLDVQVEVKEVTGTSRSFFASYTVDTAAPTGTITAPAANTRGLRAPPQIKATVSDAGSGVASVTAVVRAGANTVIATLTGVMNGDNVTFPNFTDDLIGSDGDRTIELTVIDAAGNEAVTIREYRKDTTPPTIAKAAAQRSYRPHASTNGAISGNCDVFPFSTCVVSPPSATPLPDVPSSTASSAPTFRRWAHLSDTSTAADPGPSFTIITEPGVTIKARTDITCPANQAQFDSRSGSGATADANGLALIEIGDMLGLSSFFHRTQDGSTSLCLSMQGADTAGNVSGIVSQFYKWDATTPAPLIRWNIGPFTGAGFDNDVGSVSAAQDDDVVDGNLQGTVGRYFAHAYVIAPYSIPYAYQFPISITTPPTLKVRAQTERLISRLRAKRWCLGSGIAGATQLSNPANQPAETINTPPDLPSYTAASAAERSRTAGIKLYDVTSGTSSTVADVNRHVNNVSLPALPQTMPGTTTDTKTTAPAFDINASIIGTVLEYWTVNQLNGSPTQQMTANAATAFGSGGGTFNRVTMLIARGRVPNQGISLKRHFEITNNNFIYNDTCPDGMPQPETTTKFAVVQRLPANTTITGGGQDVVQPFALMLVANGLFPHCDGTSGDGDCRYGREFTRYLGATFQFASSSTVTPRGRLNASTVNPTTFAATPIPTTATRTLLE